MEQQTFYSHRLTQEPVLINIKEFAQLLRISKRTFHRLKSTGRIPEPIMVGGRPLWPLEEVRGWINAGCPVPNAKSH